MALTLNIFFDDDIKSRKQNLHHPCHLNSADKLLVIKLGRFWLKRGLSEEALYRNSRVSLQNCLIQQGECILQKLLHRKHRGYVFYVKICTLLAAGKWQHYIESLQQYFES